jgi:cytidylate kinase
MKKTCVFITGTNAVGKTTLAKEMIMRYGGIAEIINNVTYCKEGRVCFAGAYGGGNYGGVDKLNSTRILPEIIKEGLKKSDVIICEGSFMNTFGLNLTNALFSAERQFVVSLYAPIETIALRLETRTGKATAQTLVHVAKRQKCAMIAAKKYHQIGVPTLQFNTAEKSTPEIADLIQSKLYE